MNNTVPAPNTNVGVSSNVDYDKGIEFNNPLIPQSIPQIIGLGVKILLSIIGMLAVIVIIVAGFKMVTQGDNPTAVASARKAITLIRVVKR